MLNAIMKFEHVHGGPMISEVKQSLDHHEVQGQVDSRVRGRPEKRAQQELTTQNRLDGVGKIIRVLGDGACHGERRMFKCLKTVDGGYTYLCSFCHLYNLTSRTARVQHESDSSPS